MKLKRIACKKRVWIFLCVLLLAAAGASALQQGWGYKRYQLAVPKGQYPVHVSPIVEPQVIGFADQFHVGFRAAADTTRVRADSFTFVPRVQPFHVVTSETKRFLSGRTLIVTYAATLQCLDEACRPKEGRTRDIVPPPSAIAFTMRSGKHFSLRVRWFTVHTASRISQADLQNPVFDVRQPLIGEPTYRISPTLLVWGFFSAAVLFALFGCWLGMRAFASPFRASVKQREAVQEPLSALEIIERASRGDSSILLYQIQWALDELALVSQRQGRTALSHEAHRLAWAPRMHMFPDREALARFAEAFVNSKERAT